MKRKVRILPHLDFLEDGKAYGLSQDDIDLMSKMLAETPSMGRLLSKKISCLRSLPWKVLSTGVFVEIAYVVLRAQVGSESLTDFIGYVAIADGFDRLRAEALDPNSLISLGDAVTQIALELLKFIS